MASTKFADGTRMKRVVAVVVGLLAFVPVSQAVAAPDVISAPSVALQSAGRIGNATSTEPTPTPPSVVVSSEMQRVLDLVNVERTSRGLVPLRFSEQLNEASLAHTQDQAAAGTIYHTHPSTGEGPGDRISQTGYRFSTWGENVAAGYQTPEAVMQGWMTSQGHCENILNPAFTELGVGYVTGGVRYNHFWTQSFARPSGVDRPAGTYNPAWC